MKKTIVFFLTCAMYVCVHAQPIIQFVFTSDVHYGIARKMFRGNENVDAQAVNRAMIEKINSLPAVMLPEDGGVQAGKPIRFIDAFIETGDIANRMEPPSPPASVSWAQFAADYLHGLQIENKNHAPTPVWLMPGNHDVSDAIGFSKPMQPLTDATSMAGIYNLEMHPAVAKTAQTYNYATDKINYSVDLGGIHFVCMNIWADSANRIWLEKDLVAVNHKTPVLLFMHDPPAPDPKHFADADKLLDETFRETITERNFVSFIKKHPNIKAFFHGHNNWNEFYSYQGPDHDIRLPVFRADSPMKGKISASDETKLSFQFISIDMASGKLTAREYLWNADPSRWGNSITISLQ